MTFSKHDPDAAAGFYRTEAAGLRWLGEATAAGGVPVAEVLAVTETSITLPRYATVTPTREDADSFGRMLAVTHRAGAPHHGAPAPGARDGFIGPLPMPQLSEAPSSWADFYASCRLEPFADAAEASGALDARAAKDVRAVCARLHAADQALTGPEVPPARLHGDLWSGNVLWTADGARLIDPAARTWTRCCRPMSPSHRYRPGGSRESGCINSIRSWCTRCSSVRRSVREPARWPGVIENVDTRTF
jgi:fructosamine-3-kinase